MRCVICGGDVTIKKVKEEIKVGNNVFLANVITDTCTNCGERYYSDALMEKLEKLKSRLSKPSKDILSIGHVYAVPETV